MDNNFTEATPWQYRHYAPHDIRGLSNLLGGRDSLAKSLDALFEADTAILGKRLPDVPDVWDSMPTETNPVTVRHSYMPIRQNPGKPVL